MHMYVYNSNPSKFLERFTDFQRGWKFERNQDQIRNVLGKRTRSQDINMPQSGI